MWRARGYFGAAIGGTSALSARVQLLELEGDPYECAELLKKRCC